MSKTNIKPFGKRILLDVSIKNNGFEVTDSIQLPEQATVIAIGDEVKKIKVGDTLLLKGYSLDIVLDNENNRHVFTLEDDNFILGSW